ncbi:MAG TPA: hypothetical protein VEK06_03055 [Myxococcota bacterium]|nr:hypothetical protein [Myxococcota bacterium]
MTKMTFRSVVSILGAVWLFSFIIPQSAFALHDDTALPMGPVGQGAGQGVGQGVGQTQGAALPLLAAADPVDPGAGVAAAGGAVVPPWAWWTIAALGTYGLLTTVTSIVVPIVIRVTCPGCNETDTNETLTNYSIQQCYNMSMTVWECVVVPVCNASLGIGS